MFAWNFFKSPFLFMKLQWVLQQLAPPTPSTTTPLLPNTSTATGGRGCRCCCLASAKNGSSQPGLLLLTDLSLAWRNDWQIEKQFTVEDEDGEEEEEDEEEDENDDVTSWSGSWIRRGHIKAGNELDWDTTSPTFWTATTTTSTLKCQSQKSWHSDLVCFLCNKRNFQKEFLFVFFLKDYSNFKRNYYFILVTLYCQYIWPV